MSSARTMSTQQIKKGLENIKKAQLQVLKELRGDSFMLQEKASRIQNAANHTKSQEQSNPYIRFNENNENIQMNSNVQVKSPTAIKRTDKSYQKKETQKPPNNTKSIRTNESSSSSLVSSSNNNQSYQALRKQFTSQRQELNSKLAQISNKLSTLEKQSSLIKSQARAQDSQLNMEIRNLQQENSRLNAELRMKNQQIEDSQRGEQGLRVELQQKHKEKTGLQTQVKSLRQQNTKLSRTVRQLQSQLKDQIITIKQIKEEREHLMRNQQSRLNMDLVMKEVRAISTSHDFLFHKLRDASVTMDMSCVQKESEIQNSFSRLLEYFENISNSNSSSGNYISVNNNEEQFSGNEKNGNRKNQSSKEQIKRSMIISESRAEERSQLEYFVRQMGDHLSRRQANDLIQQNESLKRKVKQLTFQLANISSIGANNNPIGNPKNNKYLTESNRLINMELEDMREEVLKFKRLKIQFKEDHEEQEKEIVKYKLRCKDIEAKLQSTERKLLESTNVKYGLEKKCQQQSIEITSLNSIVKELNAKLYPANEPQNSPLSQVRQEFTKLLQTNSLLSRQKQSLRAMNEGLQAQIQNLKYQKEQFQSNNKQKHELIEREIKQRNNLLQEINKKEGKHAQLKEELEKLKMALTLNEEQILKARGHFQDLLQQKNQQVLQLRKQIQDLYKQSRQYHQLRFKFDKLQMEYKELSRKSVKMGETLSHLWSVKQAEYHNVNSILGMLKSGEMSGSEQQSSGHF